MKGPELRSGTGAPRATRGSASRPHREPPTARRPARAAGGRHIHAPDRSLAESAAIAPFTEQRHCLLSAYLPDLAATLTDQTLDMMDKILDELVRKGKRKQEPHFQSNVGALNANLAVLTTAGDALATSGGMPWRDPPRVRGGTSGTR